VEPVAFALIVLGHHMLLLLDSASVEPDRLEPLAGHTLLGVVVNPAVVVAVAVHRVDLQPEPTVGRDSG